MDGCKPPSPQGSDFMESLFYKKEKEHRFTDSSVFCDAPFYFKKNAGDGT